MHLLIPANERNDLSEKELQSNRDPVVRALSLDFPFNPASRHDYTWDATRRLKLAQLLSRTCGQVVTKEDLNKVAVMTGDDPVFGGVVSVLVLQKEWESWKTTVKQIGQLLERRWVKVVCGGDFAELEVLPNCTAVEWKGKLGRSLGLSSRLYAQMSSVVITGKFPEFGILKQQLQLEKYFDLSLCICNERAKVDVPALLASTVVSTVFFPSTATATAASAVHTDVSEATTPSVSSDKTSLTSLVAASTSSADIAHDPSPSCPISKPHTSPLFVFDTDKPTIFDTDKPTIFDADYVHGSDSECDIPLAKLNRVKVKKSVQIKNKVQKVTPSKTVGNKKLTKSRQKKTLEPTTTQKLDESMCEKDLATPVEAKQVKKKQGGKKAQKNEGGAKTEPQKDKSVEPVAQTSESEPQVDKSHAEPQTHMSLALVTPELVNAEKCQVADLYKCDKSEEGTNGFSGYSTYSAAVPVDKAKSTPRTKKLYMTKNNVLPLLHERVSSLFDSKSLTAREYEAFCGLSDDVLFEKFRYKATIQSSAFLIQVKSAIKDVRKGVLKASIH